MRRIYKAIKPMFETDRWRVFPGDMVYINHGPHKGQSGRVLQVVQDPRVPQVIVEGINLRKKKVQNPTDADKVLVVTMEAPIHYSQVSLMEPEMSGAEAGSGTRLPSQRWVRAKFRYLADGTRVRVGAGRNATGVIIPVPPPPAGAAKNLGEGCIKDTKAAEVISDTYQAHKPSAGFNAWFTSVVGTQNQQRRPPAPRPQVTGIVAAGTVEARTGSHQYSTYTHQHLKHQKWQLLPSLLCSAGLNQQHALLPLSLSNCHPQGGRRMHTHCMIKISTAGLTPNMHVADSSRAHQALLLQQQTVVPAAG